jgi:hypothetical protein
LSGSSAKLLSEHVGIGDGHQVEIPIEDTIGQQIVIAASSGHSSRGKSQAIEREEAKASVAASYKYPTTGQQTSASTTRNWSGLRNE